MDLPTEPFTIPGLRRPRDEAEFAALMAVVEARLDARGLPLPGRAMQGFMTVQLSLGEAMSAGPLPRCEPAAGCYSGEDLGARVWRWYEARYGEALGVGGA